MKKIITFCMLFAFANASELPLDSSFLQGRLENGLRYIIKKNDKPKAMASFRLVSKIGSLEEDDDQQGVAHFVEHLAFNGTKNFEKNSLIKFLESLGVNFGSHLNASTSFDETIYKLQVPLKNDNLQKSMLIFSDWASGVNFTENEINKERGVVLEEKRASNTVGFRIFKQVYNEALKDTRQILRYPIGKEEVIKNVSLKRVKDFYDTWYQPRFMDFVVVGDFDVKEVEKLVKKYFSPLKNRNENKTYLRDANKTDGTVFKVFKDKELTSESLSLGYFAPYKSAKNLKDFKAELVEKLAVGLFNLKAQEISLQKNPPAKNISLDLGLIAPNTKYFSFDADFEDGLKAFSQLTSLMYGLEKSGFDKKDFEIAKKGIKSQSDNIIKEHNNTTSDEFVRRLSYMLSKNEPILDEGKEAKLINKLLDEISLSEVWNAYKNILDSKSKLVYFKVPDDEKIDLKKAEDIFKNARKNALSFKNSSALPNDIELKDLNSTNELIESFNDENDFYEFSLKNGVKVVYKYNDYEKNVVLFSALSKGGNSLYDANMLSNINALQTIVPSSGFGEYNGVEVGKIYADKKVNVAPYIEENFEGFTGMSSTKDFKYLFKFVYLFAKQYKVDENILFNEKQQMLDFLSKEDKSPYMKFKREFQKFYYNNNERYLLRDKAGIERINRDDMLKIYKQRFSDFNNFTFIIVGDISKEDVIKYAKLYLANLPTAKNDETYKKRGIEHLKGKQEFVRNFNNENISKITISFSKPEKFSLKKRVELKIFSDVVATKLREYIREEKSGVYGIAFYTYFNDKINGEVSSNIHFSCDPKRKKELLANVLKVLKQIEKDGVKQSYIDSSIKKYKTKLEENKKKNVTYMYKLDNLYRYGDKILNQKEINEYLNGITNAKVKQFAKEYFNTKDYLYKELSPKKELKK